MQGELDNLCKLFFDSGLGSDYYAVSVDDIKNAIAELLINCPIYRYYSEQLPLTASETTDLKEIFDVIRKKRPEITNAVNVLESVLLEKTSIADNGQKKLISQFFRRCMQFTGPLMAKGNEDTLMYTYNRFLGHNEVGDNAATFSLSKEHFHHLMELRQEKYPLAQNASATHDTKRGEDVRARLAALTDLPDEWRMLVDRWNMETAPYHNITADDKYHIYQMVLATYPMPHQDKDIQLYPVRLKEYMTKALREGKKMSSWAKPDTVYENAVKELIDILLNNTSATWPLFQQLHNKVCDYGIAISLTQLTLKMTSPGCPDIYQGNELWDLNMVDPDNRRPVDFNHRKNTLEAISDLNDTTSIENLWHKRYNGDIKLWLTAQLLHLLSHNQDLFSNGIYMPLEVKGKYKHNIIAYARIYGPKICVVILPLHIGELAEQQQNEVLAIDWEDTHVMIPENISGQWMNICAQSSYTYLDSIPVAEVFRDISFAILNLQPCYNKRKAGILLPVSSLPSDYGIGDLGKGAKAFLKFLNNSGQKIWQLLPLNPITAPNSYSPYSSISSMAGNVLLIDLEQLAEEGLLLQDELDNAIIPSTDNINYELAEQKKIPLLKLAFQRYKKTELDKTAFESFCNMQAYWLHDFALFYVLKNEYKTGWIDWPIAFKERHAAPLERFAEEHEYEVEAVKWLQYQFFRQWDAIKELCCAYNIQLLGDLPFYIAYDSVEVWSKPELFCLDNELRIKGMAGVPPDYFSSDGQLWGMPTYNWTANKKENYNWWISRLKKNMELYDILRLDHFRAFAGYWEVAATEETAKNGKWLEGPGKDFFDAVEKELGKLPFVAEDLGDYMDDVYKLRDEVNLPGMKVLQFAFGDYSPTSVDAPHNYSENTIVYTGTHDNNTIVGWYKDEADKTNHKILKAYTGIKINAKNVNAIMIKIAYASVSSIAIVPMQDVLGLDESSRMNTPGTSTGNWQWRLTSEQLNSKTAKQLRHWVWLYNRY